MMVMIEVQAYECKRIFDNSYGYLVIIGDTIYEMSTDAHLPNGVNQVFASVRDNPAFMDSLKKDHKPIHLADLPKGTLIGIIRRVQQGENLFKFPYDRL